MGKARSKVVRDPLVERLACLSEELGEAVQAIGKTSRHGLDSNWRNGPTNRQSLARELGQVTAIVMLMIDAGDLRADDVEHGEVNKYATVQQFLHAPSNKKLARARQKRYAESS
jgi:NTP pyrophosphatase (non-canonical NTP hydrolase)